MAAVGAVVTILNLAFATFTQQLISTEVLNKKIATAKPFPRSQSYQPTALSSSGFTYSGGTPDLLDFRTVSAIIGAGLQSNNALPLVPNCQTGNCTYPKPVPTLAMCGGCTDVTDKLDNQGTCEWNTPPCYKSNSLDCGAAGKPCTYSLPTGPSLIFQPGDNDNDLYAIWNATNLLPVTDNHNAATPSIAFDDDWKVYPLKIATIGLPPSVADPFVAKISAQPDGSVKGTLPPMQAYECAVWFCTALRPVLMLLRTSC